MQKQDNKLSKRVYIVNALGLHARAAGQIAALARKARYKVKLSKNRRTADASSIIDILTLNGTQGSVLKLEVEEPSDQNILDDIATLIENGFGEQS